MGRSPCCSKVGLRRGAWTAIEDTLLIDYILAHGEGNWRFLPKRAGLLRCGKSCRLRWMNYLRPGIKRGNFTDDEDDLIIRLHSLLGNRWSLIAGRLPQRTDNDIKNYWNSHLKKRLKNMAAGKTPEKPKKIIGNKSGKIYRPKPFKVTPLWTWITTWSSSSNTLNARQDERSLAAVTSEAPGLPRPPADDEGGSGGVLVDHNQHDDESVNLTGSEISSEYDALLPINDDEFEKLYEEYVELLMADI